MPRERAGGPPDPPGYGIAAVERSLDLVAAMVRLGPASLTHLAAASGCTRVNAFRILHTLEARGLASQEGKRGAWRLGVGWLAMAWAAGRDGALPRAAAPAMEALARSCAEPVTLAVRDGEQCEIVATHAGASTVRPLLAPGGRWPLHAGPGRLLLAYAPPPIQRAVLASRLPRLASATRVDPGWIAADLPRIRARDWLITTDEIAEGMVTVSAAVRDGMGEVIACLTIASPALRMRAPRPHTLLTALLTAAKQTGDAIQPGFAPATG